MTPTLLGRWQTRFLLLATVGVFVSLPFSWGWIGSQPGTIFFWVLGYVMVFGFVWDSLYIYLQRFRWDRDWPAVFQLLAGLWEAAFLSLLIQTVGLPGIPQASFDWQLFVLHYSVVWVVVFLASQMLMRILFPFWRFRGGRWL